MISFAYALHRYISCDDFYSLNPCCYEYSNELKHRETNDNLVL